MSSILITGCNRGLGLGLIKALLILPNPPAVIIGTCRNIEKSQVKKKLLSKFHKINKSFNF